MPHFFKTVARIAEFGLTRRIGYTCPETDREFVLITNEMTLRPGLI